MKLLIATNDPTEIALTQALLAGEGIETFVLDVHTSVLEGAIGIVPRRVMVADSDYADAVQALRDNGLL